MQLLEHCRRHGGVRLLMCCHRYCWWWLVITHEMMDCNLHDALRQLGPLARACVLCANTAGANCQLVAIAPGTVDDRPLLLIAALSLLGRVRDSVDGSI